MYWRISVFLALLVAFVSCSETEKPDNLEPKLFVIGASDITRTGAVIAGRVELRGGTAMPDVWFEYGTDANDMAGSSAAESSVGDGVQACIDGLVPGTQYYYRLCGGNGRVTIYSETGSFTTMPNNKPTVTSLSVLNQGPTSLIASFGITDNGGDDIIEAGCYVTDMSTGEVGKVVAVHAEDATSGLWRVTVTGLRRLSEYRLQPYASNINGEIVGEPLAFMTRDAVVIGEPGRLSLLFGEDKYEYEGLSFAGQMNGDDIRFLRQMMGRDVDGQATAGCLARVDMTDVVIVSGGGSYDAKHYTENGVISAGMFSGCDRLVSVLLPSAAMAVEKDAFRDCVSLERIVLPAGAVSVEPSEGCSKLAAIDVPPASIGYKSVDGVLFDAGVTGIIWFPIGKTGDYQLPSTVVSVGDYAFSGCLITSFVFPNSVKSLGFGAFYGSMVENVSLSDGVTTLPTATFQNCQRLKTVRLGAGIAAISEYAFDGCPLEDIYIGITWPPVCSVDAFGNADGDLFSRCVLHVPSGSIALYKQHDVWGRFDNIREMD